MAFNVEDYIGSIRDFPIPGILFRDVTPIMENAYALQETTKLLAEYGKKVNADIVVGPESRGYWFGCPTALAMNVGFVPIRKPGKLPRETVSVRYDLEYGSNEIHMVKGSIKPGQRVLIVDDLLATGGTAKAAASLVEAQGGVVAGFAFVIELFGNGMEGRQVLEDYDVLSLCRLSDQ